MTVSSDSKNKSSADNSAGKPAEASGGWNEKIKIPRRAFPGPASSGEPLRVAMTRETYAELTAHAKESLNAEIGGVLIGELCEDDNGFFVVVQGTIRATAAREGSTHVTFTQETWTKIHEEKDRSFPRQQIVGWYHTHPGFGVEFSEMDRFVHRNFFAGPGHIAFVADPLGGQEAILVNVGGEIVPVTRFWVDGRERRCQAPPGAEAAAGSGNSAVPPGVEKSLRAMDDRISQLMQMMDSQTASMHRYILFLGMFLAIGIMLFLGYNVYSAYTNTNRPPELLQFAPVPVQIGDKSVLLGVGVVKWDVPPALNSAFVQAERENQAKDKAAAVTPQAATQPTAVPTAKK
jgi:proteasome lid subunit RPN8/RPN11